MRPRLAAAAAAACIAAAAAFLPCPAGAAPASAVSEEAQSEWVVRLGEGRARVAAARESAARAQAAMRDQRQRRYPRGAESTRLRSELAKAQAELRAAEQALPALVEEARRAGVPPGLLEPDRAGSD